MPSQSTLKRHTPEERRRVLEAFNNGQDWRAIARHNGFPRTTAQYLVGHGRAENLPRGGARAAKVTPEIREALELWMEECCTYTLGTLRLLVREDFDVDISETTISRHLTGMLYSVKQIQCAVSSAYGVVAYRTKRGSIKMQDNADFVEELYKVVKESEVYATNYTNKNIVVVFDNAPDHSRTEELVSAHDDLVLLRLGPYSPMCNPIESCFSSLKAHIKQYLALTREEILEPVLISDGKPITKTEVRMRIHEHAANVNMPKFTQHMVQKMELHAAKFVNAAIRLEDMVYGAYREKRNTACRL